MRLIQLSVSSFLVSSCFCKPQKELPAVAFLQQQKRAVNLKKLFTTIWGVVDTLFEMNYICQKNKT
jgi:hypothetical protein